VTTPRWVLIVGVVAVAIATVSVITQLRDHTTTSKQALTPLRTANSLSLADVAGSNIVALTITPPAPGPVRLQVDIVGSDASRTKDIVVQATSTRGASASTRLNACGAGCFNGTSTLPGADTWTFTVQGRTSSSPFAIHLTAPFPTPDARATLTAVLARMNHLRSLRVYETLRGRAKDPVLDTQYRFQAPDRFAYDQTGASNASSIAIGRRQYERDSPASAWHVEEWPDPAGFAWPANFYNAFWTPATAVRMLGPASLHGVATHVIAFVVADRDAWFRLWIGDRDGLVHHMEMRALSHIMNQDFDRFNQPMSVAAP
jgi:hypothetical protein